MTKRDPEQDNKMLLLIDMQDDFVRPTGALSVANADKDAVRCEALINTHGNKYNSIWGSMDSHYHIDISHRSCYFKPDGTFVDPFTIVVTDGNGGLMSLKDQMPITVRGANSRPAVLKGITVLEYVIQYVEKLANTPNAYPLIIWPEHCIIGTPGHNIDAGIREAIVDWEVRNYRRFEPVVKGTSFWTEHYGFLKADVEFEGDPKTRIDPFVQNGIVSCSELHVGGQARTHCTLTSLLQIEELLGASGLHKVVVLTDLMSDIPETDGIDFPAIADAQFERLKGEGVRFAKSTEIW